MSLTEKDVVDYITSNPGKTVRDFYAAHHVKTDKHNKGTAWQLFTQAMNAGKIKRGPKVASPSNHAQACYSYFPV